VYNFMQYNLGWATAAEIRYGDGDGNDQPRSVQVRITQVGLPNPQSKVFTVTQTTGSTTTRGNNPYWQWGRKDPMPPGNGINTGERVLEYGMDINADLPYKYKWANASSASLGKAIQQPYVFFGGAIEIVNGYYNLWDIDSYDINAATSIDVGIVKTVYDPNPVGWKMPPSNAWTGLSKAPSTWDTSDSQSTVAANTPYSSSDFNTNSGYLFYLDPNQSDTGDPTVFFPASGCRPIAAGVLMAPGRGLYVSAHSSANSARCNYMNITNNGVGPVNTNAKGNAYSVRPVRDEVPQPAQP
jgi:hypothetical protein